MKLGNTFGRLPCGSIDKIIAYEGGDLDFDETIEFFAELVKTGDVWTLQGHYGRTAVALLEAGHIDAEGNVL